MLRGKVFLVQNNSLQLDGQLSLLHQQCSPDLGEVT